MRPKALALGGLLGGLTLFGWSFMSHLPPIGTWGYAAVTPESDAPVLAALGGAMDRRAIYVLPGVDMQATPEAQREWTARFEAGPSAVVLFDPRPGQRAIAGSVFAGQLITELVTAILSAALGAAIALGLSSALGYWSRVLLLAAIGAIATIDVDASYWSWYGIPTAFLLGQFIDHVGGWFLAGLVLARVCRKAPKSA